MWTWLGTLRFSAGLNKGENIYAVRYVVVEKVALSVPCDLVSFSIYRHPNIHRISCRLSKSPLFLFLMVGYTIFKDFLYLFGAKFTARKFYL